LAPVIALTFSMNDSPIGVFDSGIGGLSILQSLQAALPAEHFVYWADSGHAPYGEKSDLFVRQRSLAITQHLIAQHHIKALVVACNTATAAAIHVLRERHPQLILVGVEPALKPALKISQTGHIGVMGTRGTLGSEKFQRLLNDVQTPTAASSQAPARFTVQPCNGLALAIEQSTLAAQAVASQERIDALLRTYTEAMGPFGSEPGHIDTLVLGCTHYVFAEPSLRRIVGPQVHMVSTGEPVAKQTRRLLEAASLMRRGPGPQALAARIRLLTNGDLAGLQAAAERWLGLPHATCQRSDRQV
jgi:glutamate racemase